MKILNTSATGTLFVLVRSPLVGKAPSGRAAIPVKPGGTWQGPATEGASPTAIHLFRAGAGADAAAREVFWQGLLQADAIIDADPGTGQVTWNPGSFTQAHLDAAQAFWGGDADLASVTLDALQAHAATRNPRWLATADAGPLPAPGAAPRAEAAAVLSDCDLKIAQVVMDAVLLFLGVGEVIKQVHTADVQAQINALLSDDTKNAIRAATQAVAATAPGSVQYAARVFDVVSKLTPLAVAGIGKIALSHLDLLDKVLYGALLAGKIAVIVGLPVSAPAILAFELTISGILLIRDVTAAYAACSWTGPIVAAPPQGPGGSYLIDFNGNYLHARAGSTPGQFTVEVLSNADPADPTFRWEMVGLPGRATYYTIRNLAAPSTWLSPADQQGFMTAPANNGDPVTLNVADLSEAQTWMVNYNQMPIAGNNQPNVTTCYILENSTSVGPLFVNGNQVICTNGSGNGLLFRDLTPRDPANPEQLDIGWELEMAPNDKNWGFWNGDINNPAVLLSAQSGMLSRPDDSAYWSIVAMGRGDGSDQVIAMVRCWTDAAGPHIQAGLNVRGQWFPTGLQDPSVSVAEDPGNIPGIRLTAWLIGTSDSG